MNDTSSEISLTQSESNQEAIHRFTTQPIKQFNLPYPVYKQPEEIACFSNDAQRRFVYGDQSLRYYYPADIYTDLNDGFDNRYVERDRTQPDHLDGLLASLVELRRDNSKNDSKTQADIMCYRGVITRIMCSPYEKRDPWELGITLYKGTLYIEERETEHKRRQNLNSTRRQRIMGYWGYKFESVSTLSKPSSQLKPNDPELKSRKRDVVNTNEQYCSVYRTKLGNHTMIMGAEVDCISEEKRADQPSANYIELKTSRVIQNEHDRHFFAKKKLIKFWAQSFLAAVPKIIVGFRDDRGRVRSLGTYKTMEIPRSVRNMPDMWEPQVCLNFADQFLNWLRTVVTIDDPDVVYRAYYGEPWDSITVTCLGREGTFLTADYLQSEASKSTNDEEGKP
ncbi:RAI1 like PD-XK nuclease-domain-containing protein [Syncephalis fuscata]|nr:RAI1 like PD-XK nuclease-domain-containing protein [Syncephalis fuscata]